MSDHLIVHPSSSARRGSRRRNPLGTVARLLVRGFQRWQRHRAMAQLRGLDDWQLDDIGISRNDIPRVVEGLFRSEDQTVRVLSSAERKETSDQLREAA